MTDDRPALVGGAVGVLLVVAGFVAGGSVPALDAGPVDLVSYYRGHSGGQVTAATLTGLGALLLLAFAAAFVERLRAAAGPPPWAATLCLAGGLLVVVGLAGFAGLTLALGQVADTARPAAVQALHVLGWELFFPLTVGTGGFLVGAGVAVLRSAVLPRWLGWAALGFAVLAVVPSHVLGGVLDHVGFGGFLGLCAWVVVAALALARQTSSPPEPAA